MIDLHLHLDGSLSIESVLHLAKIQSVELPTYECEKLKELLVAPADCNSLNEYLTRFDLPLTLLQTKLGLKQSVLTLLNELQQQGIIYSEIRFAPQLHTAKGLTQYEVVQAVSEAFSEFHSGDNTLQSRILICMMRGDGNAKENDMSIELANEFKKDYVVGVDLAGAEAVFKTENFKKEFEKVSKLGLNYTIHAGEADGADSVMKAIEFGARRIGHGVRVCESESAIRTVIDNNVTLEICPISNIQTKAVLSMSSHPVIKYLNMGMKVTVNTDNMSVSDTSISKEFAVLEKTFNITQEQKNKMFFNSIEAAFIDDALKARLKNIVKINNEIK